MSALLPWLFFVSICAAFLLNFLFLGAEAAPRARQAGWKRTVAALLLLLAAFGLWAAAFRGVSPRGGYDNEHDVSLLCMHAFSGIGPASIMHFKEASPLVMDAVADTLGGFSLRAVPLKNRLLMFGSGVLLFFCVIRAGLGLPAALLAFVLYAFSFLTGLNANTFSTTSANMFFLFSALYAALALEAGGAGLRGLIWAVSAFFLVWTSRYELAFFPALVLLFSLVSPAGSARAVLADPRRRLPALAVLLLTAALCLAWAAVGIAPVGYNGPSPAYALRFLSNLEHHLDARNLSLFFPAASGGALWAVLAALAVSLYGAARSGRRAVLGWGFLLAACVYTSAVFSTRDLYPLHFMRHQLYFSVPFIALFSAACAAAWAALPSGAAAWAGRMLLAAACALYIRMNYSAALALEPEIRTNDVEWGLLLEASARWPRDCVLLYPADDNKGLLLRKYFPGYDPRLIGSPACVIKYVPPSTGDLRQPGAPPPQNYNPFSAVYAGPAGRALAERVFVHKFFTVWDDVETRQEVAVRAGFYPADSPADRAWLLNEKGLDLLREGAFVSAEKNFRQAAALDSGCEVCGINLAASLLFQGRAEEALGLAREKLARARGEGARRLLLGLEAAALGDREAARGGFREVQKYSRSGKFPVMADVYYWRLGSTGGGGPENRP